MLFEVPYRGEADSFEHLCELLKQKEPHVFLLSHDLVFSKRPPTRHPSCSFLSAFSPKGSQEASFLAFPEVESKSTYLNALSCLFFWKKL